MVSAKTAVPPKKKGVSPRHCPKCGKRPPVDKTVPKPTGTVRYFYCECGESWSTKEEICL